MITFRLKNIFLVLAIAVLFCLALSSCKDKKDTLTLDYLYDYYPLDSAHYVMYDVDSILYTYNGVHHNDTVHYQWLLTITDTLQLQNEVYYTVETYRRRDSTTSWNYDRKWKVKRTATNLQLYEDDIDFVKLVFPPQQDETWNGNVYVPTTAPYDVFQNWNYFYASVDQPYSINGLNFDHTLTVSEVDNENLIEKTLRKEVYAKGVGLIYQEWEYMTKQNVSADWNTGPEQGFRIRMKVIAHN